MRWIAISGSWRKVSPEIERDVRSAVLRVMKNGDGIVSGGALNVDSIALDEALMYDPEARRIKIFLPTTLEKYSKHYRKHARLKTITAEQAEGLISQLAKLKRVNPKALIENLDTDFTEKNKKEKYYARNSDIVKSSDGLIAFLVKTEAGSGFRNPRRNRKGQNQGHIRRTACL